MTDASDAASIREVHALIDTAEAKLSAQVDGVEARLSAQIVALKHDVQTGFERHDVAHGTEERKRVARFRWGIGIALTLGGLAGGAISSLVERLTS